MAVVTILLTLWGGCVEETVEETTTTTTKATLNASICSGIENLSERFACYTGLKFDSLSGDSVGSISAVAVRFLDPDLCELIGDYEMSGHGRFYCFTEVAYALKDPSICDRDLGYSTFFHPQCKERVESVLRNTTTTTTTTECDGIEGSYQKNECYIKLAKEQKNLELCKKLEAPPAPSGTTGTSMFRHYQDQQASCYCEVAVATQNTSLCPLCAGSEVSEARIINCYTDIAVAKQDASICEKIQDLEYRNLCYHTIVNVTENSKICEKIQESVNFSKEGCYRYVAMKKGDPAICNKINDTREKTYCLIDLAGKLGELRICNSVSGYEENYMCRMAVARKTNNPSICGSMTNPAWNERCIWSLLKSNPDPRLCENVHEIMGLKDYCYKKIAVDLANATICDFIKENTTRDVCYSEVSGGD